MIRRPPRSTLFPYPPLSRSMLEAPLWPLPAAVFTRPKTGFGIPIREWLSARAGTEAGRNRGLRGWAKVVYRNFVNHRSEEHTSELQSQSNLVCRLLLEKKKT